jgi:c-di-GMP-binding flagellar brake protein YcgR
VKKRHVRIVLPRTEAIFNGRRCRIFDLSVTGALLLLDYEPTVGDMASLVLDVAASSLSLATRVVRTKAVEAAANPHATAAQWTAGVMFLDVSPMSQRSVARFCTLILDESNRKPR